MNTTFYECLGADRSFIKLTRIANDLYHDSLIGT
jgi:hypothetical protein